MMSEQWVDLDWERKCLDHGPTGSTGSNRRSFTGYHHMCCLNNMIPPRSDVREIFNAFEIGIDVHVHLRVLPLKIPFIEHTVGQ
jgi:hypothetical protein